MNSEPNSNKIWRILIVDDHAVMREGIAAILNKEPDLSVCAEAESPAEALERLEVYGEAGILRQSGTGG